MATTVKDICNQLVIALREQEDGRAIKALTDLTYESVCRTLGLNHGKKAELAIGLALLAKRAGHIINLEEEVRAAVVLPSPTTPAPEIAPTVIKANNEDEPLDIEIALAELDKAIAEDQAGDIDPHAPVEDEVLALSAEGSLIDRLFYEMEKQTEEVLLTQEVSSNSSTNPGPSQETNLVTPTGGCARGSLAGDPAPVVSDSLVAAAVARKESSLGEQASVEQVLGLVAPAEFDFSGNYELTEPEVETIEPERGFGMDFGFVSLGE